MSEILLLVAHFYSTIVQSGQKKVLHTSQCTNIYPQSNHCKHDRTLPFQNAIFIEVSVRIFHHLRSGVRWSKTKLFCCFIFCCWVVWGYLCHVPVFSEGIDHMLLIDGYA